MISYRQQLSKIGYAAGEQVHYVNFGYRPTSLRKAMRAMDAPHSYALVTEAPGRIDESWTEEVQGVIWDGAHWLFSSNGSGSPSVNPSPKAIYTFNGNNGKFKSPDQTFVINPAGINHIGPMYYQGNILYVEHWIGEQASLLTYQNNNGTLSYQNRINIESIKGGRVGVVGIDFENGVVYTCPVGLVIPELYIHKFSPDHTAITYTGKTLPLNPILDEDCYVQGGFFSPNGHLYISSGRGGISSNYQYIYCYSAISGKRINRIEVLAEKKGGFTGIQAKQELEGICYAPVTRGGKAVQIHAVLLENIAVSKDNIFFKSFVASEPDLI
ncbi:hypothetical protein [Hymenobacter sp. GOD-10R]|uniref:hypothetical protein n=1 Tax=Hymenobacter sp. GOD-10R TaxID=3093922 RepID=UPI002D79FF32|nr:hypothetical protein [Hymenobacter sp. GOD-10R]WRQ31779.1 hypothetical protein SD425_28430 [Hymenobacter sp. GOD-10R]